MYFDGEYFSWMIDYNSGEIYIYENIKDVNVIAQIISSEDEVVLENKPTVRPVISLYSSELDS